MIQADCHWENPPEELNIGRDIVHLWRLHIPAAVPHLEKLAACLTPEEHSRGRRFKVSAARDSFVIGRSVLRILIGRYTQTSAPSVAIRYTALGKPYLDEAVNRFALSFNLSHSGEWLVYAFGRSSMLGVDVEFHRKSVQSAEIAKRFFAPAEQGFLLRFHGDEKRRIFYEMWVRKEACLKAMGTGLSKSLRDLELPFVENAPALLRLPHQEECEREWWLYPCSIAKDHSCALVSSPPPEAVRHFHWTPNDYGL